MSSDMRVQCSACGARFRVSVKFAGRSAPCLSCKRTIVLLPVDDEGDEAAKEPAQAPTPEPAADSPTSGHVSPTKLGSTFGGTKREPLAPSPAPVAPMATPTPRRAAPHRSNQGAMLLVGGLIAGGLVGVLVAAGNVWGLSSGAKPVAKGKGKGKPKPTVVVEPEKARPVETPKSTTNVTTAPSVPKTASTPRVPNDVKPGARPAVDDAPPGAPQRFLTAEEYADPNTTIPGFAGWHQNFEFAQRLAQSQKKPVLVVFTESEGGQNTERMASEVFAKQEFRDFAGTRYVPVVIDRPTSQKSFNRVQNFRQNMNMFREFRVGGRGDPTIMLFDHQGKPFARHDGPLEGGVPAMTTKLTQFEPQQAERDRLTAGATTGDADAKLAGALALLKWLAERSLQGGMGKEVEQWVQLGKAADPNNAKGQYEAVFEPYWLRALSEDGDDAQERKRLLDELAQFKATCKFVDQDLAARLHAQAGLILLFFAQNDENAGDAGEHGANLLAEAATFDAKDPGLLALLARIKKAASRLNIVSSGTGFVITDQGHMLTNHHVISTNGQVAKGKIRVNLPRMIPAGQPPPTDSEPFTVAAEVLASDAERDLALIKIEPPADWKAVPVPVAAGQIGRGSRVAAWGYPVEGGRVAGQVKLTQGIVSSLPSAENDLMFVLDMRVNPGNSGGPLFDPRGNVIGVITAKSRRMNQNEETYGYAISTPEVEKFLTRFLPGATLAPASTLEEQPDWAKIDELVSPSVMMILVTR